MSTNDDSLRVAVEAHFERPKSELDFESRQLVHQLIEALNQGEIRAAQRHEDGQWQANVWVKKGILLAFRVGQLKVFSDQPLVLSDKDTLPLRRPPLIEHNIRIVPGGSSIRDGAYIGHNVTCMPPMYVNIGAWVDDDTLIDSHALVGSCAQVGKRVHLSASAQIGGVLEPVGLTPVVVEDDVLVGGNTGIYEGTVVRRGAVIGAGTILTASTRVYDLVHGRVLTSEGGGLEIPEDAVVVPGSRPAKGDFAAKNGLHIYTPLIVKYRDDKTDLRAALEGDLR